MLDHGALDHANISEAHAHRHAMRHSAAHVMADAVLKLFPEAKMGIGPPTQDGFYYDFDVSRPFTPEDLERIEGLMREAMSGGFPFEREELSRQQAQDLFADQPYKLELIEGLDNSAAISIYRHNGFVDLCQGPHVGNTAEIPALKLLSVAGAYWRGDEKRPMLQRIYGTAFESEDELSDHLARLEEAERRDHRTLGLVKPAEVVIHGDAGAVASELTRRLQGVELSANATRDDRLGRVRAEKAAWRRELDSISSSQDLPMAPRTALRELELAMPADAMVTTDIGNICSVANSYLHFDRPNSMFAAMMFGNCGYAFPTAMGAKVAAPERPAIAYVGDGAWGMSLAEVMTCVRENIPVVACVFNNGQWGAEKRNQIDFYDDRYVATMLENPSFAAIARAMGAEGEVVEKPQEVGDALRAAVESERPTVLEIQVSDSAWSLREVRPAEITTTFRGRRNQMFAARFERPVIRKVLDQIEDTVVQVPLSTSEVIYDRELGLDPVGVSPGAVTVYLEERVTKRVAVSGRTDARAAAGVLVVGMQVAPDSVWLQGPASFVNQISEVTTATLQVGAVSTRVTQQLEIALPPDLAGLSVEPATVIATVDVDSLRTRLFASEVVTTGPRALMAAVDPPTVTVAVTGPAAIVDGLDPADVRVTVDIPISFESTGSYPVRAQLPDAVAGTVTIDLIPERVSAGIASDPPDR